MRSFGIERWMVFRGFDVRNSLKSDAEGTEKTDGDSYK